MVPGSERGAPVLSSRESGVGQVERGKAAPGDSGGRGWWWQKNWCPSVAGGRRDRGPGGGCSWAADLQGRDSVSHRWPCMVLDCFDLVLAGWYLQFCPSLADWGGGKGEVRVIVTG